MYYLPDRGFAGSILAIILVLFVISLGVFGLVVFQSLRETEATVQSQMLELSRQDATIDAFTYVENCENAKASLAYLRGQLREIEKDKKKKVGP